MRSLLYRRIDAPKSVFHGTVWPGPLLSLLGFRGHYTGHWWWWPSYVLCECQLPGDAIVVGRWQQWLYRRMYRGTWRVPDAKEGGADAPA